jgi:putative pyruvate formate lyase activating enzyme
VTTHADTARLEEQAERLHASLASCELCPRRCRVNRLKGETGFCGVGERALFASAGPHYGEEDVLVGRGGSGTIFFGGCNLGCIFCQNADLSHGREGDEASPPGIAAVMLHLQRCGCHNINFVTPTHVTPQMMAAILIARDAGLQVPIVYNCGGYEALDTLRALDGFVDIYMPDAKYADSEAARQLSGAPDYPEVVFAALREMHRQVGDLETDGDGIATRGLLVRHLVLPNGLAGSRTILDFLAREVSPNTYVNVMAQYRPCYRAAECAAINRPPTREEFGDAYRHAASLGLRLAR